MTTNDPNPELVDICTVYEVAVGEAFQLRVGPVETPVAVSCGATRAGAAGAAMMVVNELTVENALVPPEFVALTRQ